MKRTQLNLDEKTYYQLVSYAERKKTSLSAAARKLISKQLEEKPSKSKNKNPFLELANLGERLKVKGGPKDLSENIDYYLYVEPYLTKEEKKNWNKDK